MKATLSTEIKQLKLQKPQCGTPQMPWKSSDNSQVKRCQNRSCSSSGLEGLMYPTEPWLWVILAGPPNQTALLSPWGLRSPCSSWGSLPVTHFLPGWMPPYVKVCLHPIVFVPMLPFNLNCVCFLVVTSSRY